MPPGCGRHHLTDQRTAQTHLEVFQISDCLDLAAKPSAHLRAGIPAGEVDHVVFRVELAH
jgi:hypothetical protein